MMIQRNKKNAGVFDDTLALFSLSAYHSLHGMSREPEAREASKSRVNGSQSANRQGAPGPCAFSYPHRADSMGMICFFLDMIRGRKASWSRSSVLKACWKVSSPPTHSTLLPSRSTSVSISSIML